MRDSSVTPRELMPPADLRPELERRQQEFGEALVVLIGKTNPDALQLVAL